LFRLNTQERRNWKSLADEYGFKFHTMLGQVYWDETAYYQFTLEQIEKDIEAPTEEIHQMCLSVIHKVINSEQLLKQFCIPENQWDLIKSSWQSNEPSLYSRLDFAYNGSGPAKLYENNADTPTSVFETGLWQWLWLEDKIKNGSLNPQSDQFNSLQEKLIERFEALAKTSNIETLHFSCCKDTEEDIGTVEYLKDCAEASNLKTKFVYIEDIGYGKTEDGQDVFTDLDNQIIECMFKLYPWEFMFSDAYAKFLKSTRVKWLEPAWKSLLSNKALLPMLWKDFPNHPNLLPAYFENEFKGNLTNFVKKPIFSREGANIEIIKNGKLDYQSDGPYGEEGYIYQAYHPLPKFGDSYTLIGSWLVDGISCGMSIREDKSIITQDLSRYLPHVLI
jgi:glutathionylspermidine synthase